jgi:hypothetical protein
MGHLRTYYLIEMKEPQVLSMCGEQVCREDVCSTKSCHLNNFLLFSQFGDGPAKRRNDIEAGHMPYNKQTNKCHGTL